MHSGRLLWSAETDGGDSQVRYIVCSLVGMDRSVTQAAFAEYLVEQAASTRWMRFVDMIAQVTARGAIDAGALYEPPFSNPHAGGPDELLAGHEGVIGGILEQLRRLIESVLAMAGCTTSTSRS